MGGYDIWSPSRCHLYRTYETDYDSSGILRDEALQRITQVPLREQTQDANTSFCAFHCRQTPGACTTEEELRDIKRRQQLRLRAELARYACRIRRKAKETREAVRASVFERRKWKRMRQLGDRLRRAAETPLA
nr:ORF3 [Lepus torque teno virus 2]QIJ55552.1 ORF3 [Lepus torque teno virus 2]